MITDIMLYQLTNIRNIIYNKHVFCFFVFLNLYIYSRVLYKLKRFATDPNPRSLEELQAS